MRCLPFAFLCVAVTLSCGGQEASSPAEVTEVTLPKAPSADVATSSIAKATPRHALTAPTPPASSRAASSEDVAAARSLYTQGVQAFDLGDYARAKSAFARAYALVPRAPVLLKLADCEMHLADRRAACAHIEQFWMEGPPSQHPDLLGKYGSLCPHLSGFP